MSASALVLGCGYVGLRLAAALRHHGMAVAGTTRSTARFPEIVAAGAEPLFANVLEPESLAALAARQPDLVFDLVRPQRTGEDRFTTWGTRNVASAFIPSRPASLVYLSSTSVYGRRDGAWTDETTPVAPASPLGSARIECEAIYAAAYAAGQFPVRICRSPGIYGPGRTLRSRLEQGAYTRVDDDNLWVSRIHVDDLVRGLIAAALAGSPGEVYLLCDNEPVTGREYAELTASLLSRPVPPAVDREDIREDLTASAFERRISARRCDNRRMREELRVTPRYPSVREGVPAALAEEGAIEP